MEKDRRLSNFNTVQEEDRRFNDVVQDIINFGYKIKEKQIETKVIIYDILEKTDFAIHHKNL